MPICDICNNSEFPNGLPVSGVNIVSGQGGAARGPWPREHCDISLVALVDVAVCVCERVCVCVCVGQRQ